MASWDLATAMLRLVAMEKDSIAAVVSTAVDGVTYYPYQQESFPYWHNRMLPTTVEWVADDYPVYRVRIVGRLVIGHLKEGYKGQTPDKVYDYVPEVYDYFDRRPMMTSTDYPTDLDDIYPDDGLTILGDSGFLAFVNSGIGVTDVGIEFTFEIPFIVQAS